MEQLINISPPLLFALAAVLYFFFALLKKEWLTILLICGSMFLLSFMFLPGGKTVFDKTRDLPTATDKTLCLFEALRNRAPFNKQAAQKSDNCSFDGQGVTTS